MALTVAREAVQRSSCVANRVVDQIVVCATSLEHDLALSCAGRLHSEFRSTYPPFATGQLQGVCAFLALQIASDMMAQDERMNTILIAGAERWLPPFSRVIGSLGALGDGAAAALVQRGTQSGWHVRSLTLHTPCLTTSRDEEIDASLLLEVIAETLSKAKLQSGEIDWVVPARINPSLALEISTRAQLPEKRIWYPQPADIGYLCSADALAQLDTLLQWLVPSEGKRILLWSAGLQGQTACAILEFRGS
ncbi:3-oxoacyl-[acyl-carrier-protein] synthase III C-terminal domain-containing protein [Paraburkholderia sp. A3RO-2L]|uniref:3-oxoacyl-[acyl-carrier-protein] synthase III C-terminal domain-containing protein n=1 Tax=Paraburkholderia sp. A3RO-2L TaxID=3028376 RepID=UPI003DA9E8EB